MIDTTPVRRAAAGSEGVFGTAVPSTLRVVIYARQSTEFQASLDDQIRVCTEWAERNGLSVQPDSIYTDEQSGQEANRPSWQTLREAIRAGKVNVFVVHNQSRMFRDVGEAISFWNDAERYEVWLVAAAENQILNDGESSLDSFLMRAVCDQRQARGLASHIRTAQETLFLRGEVHGTVTYGYRGEPVDGRPTKRGRPRCKIAIDTVESGWVRTVFRWFGVDEWTISKIVRELNNRGVPVRRTSRTRRWTHTIVRKMLGNPRYVGDWEYGRTKRVKVTGQKTQYMCGVEREQPLRTAHAEHLRIIDDVLWGKVQQRLANHKRRAGRRPRDGDRKARPLILNDMYVCEQHNCNMVTGGSYGKYMLCPRCHEQAEPALVSMLPRQRSLELICRELAGAIRGNAGLVDEVVRFCQEEERRRQGPDVSGLKRLKGEESNLKRRIEFIYRSAGSDDGAGDVRRQELKNASAELAAVRGKIAELEAAASRPVVVPTKEEVIRRVDDLCYTLLQAAESSEPRDAAELRRILQMLTGGRIVVSQQGEPRPQRGWPRITFWSKLMSYVLMGYGVHHDEDDGVEVSIDVRRHPTHEVISDAVKELADQGVPVAVIAKKFNVGKVTITKALRYWHTSRGLEPPDYRSLRSRLKQRSLPKYQAIAEEAARLAEEPLLLIEEIAERVGTCCDTAKKAIKWWRQRHGQPVTDFRHRRKEVTKQRRKQNDRRHDGVDRSAATA